jgi:thioesterase domain-containing protein/acyl carrier protein
VARGYLGRPDLTGERFVPDPYSGVPGARMYRTGDRVRRLPCGTLEYLGRFDDQVKIRGFRIELGEVESALLSHPGVREAAVVVRGSAAEERRLVAYLTLVPGGPTVDEMRTALRARLPEHMVPARIVALDALPLTPNGKVDRAALPEPAAAARGEARAAAPPSGAVEEALAALWEEVLEVTPVGVDDDFFALGGHSMLAVRLMTHIRQKMGVELPLAALFEHPTIRGLAPRVEGGTHGAAWSPLVTIQPEGERVPLFFVHPIGGQVLCYAELARHLGPDQPFYGLQAPDLATIEGEETSIEAMAARYVEAIREVWPRGPYLLGGWSFGGLVAFEMAQQLDRAGEAVPLVAILDTASPRTTGELAALDESQILATLAGEEALKAGTTLALSADDLRPLDPEARVARTLDSLRGAGVLTAEIEPEWVHRLLRGHQQRRMAMARYTPAVYPGRLVLFHPTESLERDRQTEWSGAAGWRPYTSEPLLVQSVPGHHATMASGPHAATLARRLRAVMDDVLTP